MNEIDRSKYKYAFLSTIDMVNMYMSGIIPWSYYRENPWNLIKKIDELDKKLGNK